MTKTNPALDVYEAPHTLNELLHIVVAYTERFIWARHPNRFVYLAMNLAWNEKVSNSHHAPFNRHTNWGPTDSSKPTHYPGWRGRIWFATQLSGRDRKDSITYWPSNALSQLGVHCGTGGGGTYRLPAKTNNKIHWQPITDYFFPWGFDVRIFEQDWPSIRLAHLIDPNNPENKRTFDSNRDMYHTYINNPHDPKKLALSRHTAKLLDLQEEPEPLKFAQK